MAKDDYHVIVYQILSYLYKCLKKDIPINGKNLSYEESKFFDIPKTYWSFIMVNMYHAGWIEGITLTKAWGEEYPLISDLDNCRITPAGIEYLCDNSFMEKAKHFLKDVKDITPFI